MMSPILEVVAPPRLTATVGSVRLMLTPLMVGAVNVRAASLPTRSRIVLPFKAIWPMETLPLEISAAWITQRKVRVLDGRTYAPVPSAPVRSIAAPPAVLANWKVLAVALTT